MAVLNAPLSATILRAPLAAVFPAAAPAGYALPDLTAGTTTYNPDNIEFAAANAWPASGFAIAAGLTQISVTDFLFVAGECPPISSLLSLGSMFVSGFLMATGDIPAPPPNMAGEYTFKDCPLVTGYEGGDFMDGLEEVVFSGNGLTEVAVDAILAGMVSGGLGDSTFCFIDLSGGTNAPPSATGLLDVLTLEGRGCDVEVNT